MIKHIREGSRSAGGRFWRMLRADCGRAFRGWRFWAASLLVFGIAALSGYAYTSNDIVSMMVLRSGGASPIFLFCVAPVFPYAASYALEYRERAVPYACLRGGALRYTAAKYITAVLSGMLAYALGTVLFIAVGTLSAPLYTPDTCAASAYSVFLGEERPMLYFLFCVLHDCFTAAIFAGLSFFLTALKPNVFIGAVAPVVLYVMYLRIDGLIAVPIAFSSVNLVQEMYNAGSPARSLSTKALTAVVPVCGMGALSCLLIRRRLSHE